MTQSMKRIWALLLALVMAAAIALAIGSVTAKTAYAAGGDTLHIVILGNKDMKDYNGSEQSITGYRVEYRVNGGAGAWTEEAPEGVSVELAAGCKAEAKGTDVGQYSMGLTKDSFDINCGDYDPVVIEVDDGLFEIIRPEESLTITANDQTRSYNGTFRGENNATYTDADDIKAKVKVEGLKGNDKLTSVTLSGGGTEKGTYDIEVTGYEINNGKGNDNYYVTCNKGTLTIKDPDKLDIWIDGWDIAEGEQYIGYEQSLSGFVVRYRVNGGAEIEGTPEGVTVKLKDGCKAEARGTDVGIYYMGLTEDSFVIDPGDYVLDYVSVTDGRLTITRAPLTITVKDQTYEYNGKQQGEGDTIYNDAALIAEKVTVEGLQGGDTLTSVILDGEGTDIGDYPIEITGYQINKGDGNKNYKVTLNPGTLSITKPRPAPAVKVSGILMASMTASGSSSLNIKWDKITGAEGYDVFLGKCGSSTSFELVKTVKGSDTLSWTATGLNKKTAYKAYVRAWVMKDGRKTYVRTSPTAHAFTSGGTKSYTNSKSVTVKKKSVSLKKGKTYKIKASVKKLKKGKKLMPKSHAAKLRYKSSNTNVATVNGSGKITAQGKGTCYVYVYAVNGAYKKVKVKVK